MLQKYKEWIRGFVLASNERVDNKCTSATEDMVKSFPELKRVAGFVFPTKDMKSIENQLPRSSMIVEELRMCWDREIGVVQHWWCKDEAGEIVDPTAFQYKHWSTITYVEYSEEKHGPMPRGRCMDCGELCFPPWGGVCSEECKDRFEKYLAEENDKALPFGDPATEKIQKVDQGQSDQGEE